MTDRREQTSTYVACLDAETGALALGPLPRCGLVGRREHDGLGMGDGLRARSPTDLGHRLLSLDGPTVYYQTNLGAVAALDAETGAIRWVATYPAPGPDRRGRGPRPRPEPGDRPRRPGDRRPRRRRGDLRLRRRQRPARLEDRAAPRGGQAGPPAGRRQGPPDRHRRPRAPVRRQDRQARPLLARQRPRPTRGSAGACSPATRSTGRPGPRSTSSTRPPACRSEPPIKLQESFQTTGGNLAVGDGYLIVAQADRLVVFCQNSRLIQRYREEIARAPEQAVELLPAGPGGRGDRPGRAGPGVARRGAAAGPPLGDDRRRAPGRRGPRPPVPPPDEARAQGRAAERDWAQAARRFEAAAEVARSDRDRLAARLLWPTSSSNGAGPPRRSSTLQQLLFDDRLRPLNINTDDGHRTIRADLLIGDRLVGDPPDRRPRPLRRVRPAGRGAARAGQGRERSPAAGRGGAELSRSPLAVPEALLALGRLYEAAQRPAEAAHAYKRLLAARRRRHRSAPAPSGAWPGPTRRSGSGCRPATPTPRPSRGSPTSCSSESGPPLGAPGRRAAGPRSRSTG